MPNFSYRTQTDTGEIAEGIVQAASSDVAAEILTDRGSTVLSLEELQPSLFQSSLKIFNRIKTKDLVIFSRQLSVIVSATIPLVQGLKILVSQTESPLLKSVISEVGDDVEGGAKLSAALSQHPEAFSQFYISIIQSGETSGKLDEVLNYLADQQEKDYDLTAKIKGAMIYPAFILSGLLIVGALMMIVVIPELTSILAETGTELPFSTKLLIAVSNFLTSYWWLLVLGIAGVVAGTRVFVRTEQGRLSWDTLKIKLPIFGPLFKKIALVRFTRSLNTLLTGGVPVARSLLIVSEVTGNAVYKRLILRTIEEVENGNSIAAAFSESTEMPLMVSQMLALGERTGRIDEILEKLANFYGREVDNTVANLVTLIEPMVMLLMGVAVGLLVAAIILPMYNLASAF